jgi:hypothetical protein
MKIWHENVNNVTQILTLPKANRLLSNNNKIPKNKKNIPKPARPTPISGNVTFVSIIAYNCTKTYFGCL